MTSAKDGFFRKVWFAPGTVLRMGSYKEFRDKVLLSADFIVVLLNNVIYF